MVMIGIYLHCERYDEALDEIEELLAIESSITVNDLKQNRAVDPIRDHPRFKELIARYGDLRSGL
jgi:hypothetical protein